MKEHGKGFVDMAGQKFNHLTVLEQFPFNTKDKKSIWIVQCDCEAKTIFTTTGKNLRSGNTKSCGCAQVASVIKRNTTHGMGARGSKRTRIYNSYHDMLKRCYNENNVSYPHYGARGIGVCDEWRGEHGFENFYTWSIEHGYYEQPKNLPKSSLLSIERKNVDKDYSPENCMWILYREQMANRTISVRYNIAGIIVPSAMLAEYCGVKPKELTARYENHWSSNEIVHYALIERLVAENHGVRKITDVEGNKVLIPNYSKLNPWSDDVIERNFARIYLTDDTIEWLLAIKERTNQ